MGTITDFPDLCGKTLNNIKILKILHSRTLSHPWGTSSLSWLTTTLPQIREKRAINYWHEVQTFILMKSLQLFFIISCKASTVLHCEAMSWCKFLTCLNLGQLATILGNLRTGLLSALQVSCSATQMVTCVCVHSSLAPCLNQPRMHLMLYFFSSFTHMYLCIYTKYLVKRQLHQLLQPIALKSSYFNIKQSFTGLEIHECIIKVVQEGLASDNLCSYEIQRNCYLLTIM